MLIHFVPVDQILDELKEFFSWGQHKRNSSLMLKDKRMLKEKLANETFVMDWV